MQKHLIEITVAELGAIITDHDETQAKLMHKRRIAKRQDREAVDSELLVLKRRTSELEAYFDTWTLG